jgi:S-adenosylmethionine:tRNA ribosyltransferase-isomerase
VGLGTFLPVKSEQITDHQMHSEWVELTAENAEIINAAKKAGRRVIAVGTTTVRVLEGLAERQLKGSLNSEDHFIELQPFAGDLNLFILPGFRFKIIDGLITNFHLPKSTLLMLVSAFMGSKDFVLACYHQAVAKQYRFYSFGDAMLIL